MDLKDIGFYTLSDARVRNASATSPLQRCELVLTSRCNFKCPYCRRIGGSDISTAAALVTIDQWAADGLRAIRFSGGEPTLHKGLRAMVEESKHRGIERVAISTNGSAPLSIYERLIEAGADDFSVSLDACCASDAEVMAGGHVGAFDKVVRGIEYLAKRVYTTVGVVLTPLNAAKVGEIIAFADSMGVADIRVIPAAQCGSSLSEVKIAPELLDKYKILRYRVENARQNRPVRGLSDADPCSCGLVLDDIAACGDSHYPCIIYMREGGAPIGKLGKNVRREREKWHEMHCVQCDPICKANCLDVCVAYNRKFAAAHWDPSRVGHEATAQLRVVS